MGSLDLIRSSLDSIRQISDEVADAVLYIDAGCSEAFQSFGAFPLFLELGARAICSLENASSLDTSVSWNLNSVLPAKKIMFITSSLLSDAHRYILHCLSLHRKIIHCTIYTSISEVAHSTCVDCPLGPDAFEEYESLLLQDYDELVKKSMTQDLNFHQHSEIIEPKGYGHSKSVRGSQLASTKDDILISETSSTEDLDGSGTITYMGTDGRPRLVVSVNHFPMILCTLSPRVFVLPSEGTLGKVRMSNNHEDALSPGLPSISTGVFSDSDDMPSGPPLLAHFLYELVSKMDLKVEIFSLGDLSQTIGKILIETTSLYEVGRRHKRSAGILLIDRSLDLLTPCCHGDSLVDRMLSSLPHRKGKVPSLHTRDPHLTNKNGPFKVERPSIDARIPLGNIISNKEETQVSKNQLSEGITAFISGWNSKSSECETVDLINQGGKFNNNSLFRHDFDGLSGSLIANETYLGANFLEALFDRRTKDGAMLIKKWLIETIRREKIPFAMKGRLSSVSASDLHSLITLLASNEMALIRNKGIIQLAVAAEIALSEHHSSHWDAFMSAERMFTISAGDTSQSLSSSIRDIINTSIFVRSDDHHRSSESSHLLSFQDALLLMVTGYILAGENFPTSGANSPFSWEEEHSLKEAIVDAILEMPIAPKVRFLHGLEGELETNSRKGEMDRHQKVSMEPSNVDNFDGQWGSWDDEGTDHGDEQVNGNMQLKLELQDRVDKLFKSLHKLSGLKWKNPTLRKGHIALESYFGGDTYSRRGLISKLLTMVLAKNDIPGLEYHSSAVGRFFKSGFSRFGLGQSKPNLGDQNVLLIFVVGGINGLEVFEAQKAISESDRPDIELILGGNAFLTPDNMFELLLGSSSYT